MLISAKKKKDIKKLMNNHGMTMVEVIMGFLILSIILGGVSGIIAFASRMYFMSADLKRAQENITARAYQTNVTESKAVFATDIDFSIMDEDGNIAGPLRLSDGTRVSFGQNLYKIGVESMFTSEEADGLGDLRNIDIYLFHE